MAYTGNKYKGCNMNPAAVDFTTPVFPSANWLSSYTNDDSSVSAFCRKHDLLEALKATITLVGKSFSSIANMRVGLSEDPEGGDEKLVVEVRLACPAEEAHRGYDEFIAKWIDQLEWEARKWICLSYSIG